MIRIISEDSTYMNEIFVQKSYNLSDSFLYFYGHDIQRIWMYVKLMPDSIRIDHLDVIIGCRNQNS